MVTEQTEVTQESTEQVSEVEQAEKVSEEPEKVSEQTFKQEDIDKAITHKLAEAEKEWQSRKDRELSEYQTKISNLEKQTLATLEAREIDSWGDTAEVKEFQAERRKLYESKAEFEPLRNKIEAESRRNEMVARGMKARELADANGMDVNDLINCNTPEEMNGLVAIWNKFKEKNETDKTPVQIVDSGAPSTAGVDLNKMSAAEQLRWGVLHQRK